MTVAPVLQRRSPGCLSGGLQAGRIISLAVLRVDVLEAGGGCAGPSALSAQQGDGAADVEERDLVPSLRSRLCQLNAFQRRQPGEEGEWLLDLESA